MNTREKVFNPQGYYYILRLLLECWTTINPDNVVYIKVRSDTINQEYVPCKRCDP